MQVLEWRITLRTSCIDEETLVNLSKTTIFSLNSHGDIIKIN